MGIIVFVSLSAVWILSDFIRGGADEVDEFIRKTKVNKRNC